MNRLVVSARAALDLEEIGDYIARDNPAAAIEMIDRLEETSCLLCDYPYVGVAREDIAKDVRSFSVGRYLVLYKILKNGVEIVRYVHGARRLQGIA